MELTSRIERASAQPVWVFVMLFLAACGSGISEASQAVEALMDEGLQRDVAECIVEGLDIVDDVDESDIINQTSVGAFATQRLLGPCLNDDALVGLLGVSSLDEVRAVLASRLSESGAMNTEQAFCLIDMVEGDGFSLVDIGGYTAGTPEADGVVASLESARASCVGE